MGAVLIKFLEMKVLLPVSKGSLLSPHLGTVDSLHKAGHENILCWPSEERNMKDKSKSHNLLVMKGRAQLPPNCSRVGQLGEQ